MKHAESAWLQPWTVFVATRDPEKLGFCHHSAWPRVGDPADHALHLWGGLLSVSDKEVTTVVNNCRTIVVLGFSPYEPSTGTACTGVPTSLLPPELPSISAQSSPPSSTLPVICLMPGCKYSPIDQSQAVQIEWPFCPGFQVPQLDSSFYPVVDSAVWTCVWVKFDPTIVRLLYMASSTVFNAPTDSESLLLKIGTVPSALITALSPKLPEVDGCIKHSDNNSLQDAPPKSFRYIRSLLSWAVHLLCRNSFTLTVLERHFDYFSSRTGSKLLPSVSSVLSFYSIFLLLMTFIFNFIPNPSDASATRQCQLYLLSSRELVRLSDIEASNFFKATTPEGGRFCSFNAVSSLMWGVGHRETCATSGPYQEAPSQIVRLFLGVSLQSWKSGCLFELPLAGTEFFASELTRLLIWLGSAEPAGLKINRHLSKLMSRFFLSHVAAWKVYVDSLIGVFVLGANHIYDVAHHLSVACSSASVLLSAAFPFVIGLLLLTQNAKTRRGRSLCIIDLLMHASSCLRLTISISICLLLDILTISALHLVCFYVYTVRLFRVQLLAVASSWRLCRSSSKWNPLRNRVDTIRENDELPPVVAGAVLVQGDTPSETSSLSQPPDLYLDSPSRHLDRVFVATFLGVAIGLCLLPTTFAFYATFSLIYVFLLFVRGALTRVVCFLLAFPIGASLRWLFNCSSSRRTLVLTAPVVDSIHVPLISLELVEDGLSSILQRETVFDTSNLFDPSLSVYDVVHRLVFAKLLYQLD
uniref:Phosphatidylinositol N-acetylglucosaminyltransferase subunit Q n=2 Tax=Schistocephalus solidus TaxID=70667 RepID=A0A0X3NUL2_SCHSO